MGKTSKGLLGKARAEAFVDSGLGATAEMAERANAQLVTDAELLREPGTVTSHSAAPDTSPAPLADLPHVKSTNIGEKVLGAMTKAPHARVVEPEPLVAAQQKSAATQYDVKDADVAKAPHAAEVEGVEVAAAPATAAAISAPVAKVSRPESALLTEPLVVASTSTALAPETSHTELSIRDRFAQVTTLGRIPPPSGRYTVLLPEDLYRACVEARGDVPVLAWFVALVARYHDEVFKSLPGVTPHPQLGLIQKRQYRRNSGALLQFALQFATKKEAGRAQQALFEECLKSASTVTEYVVAILQAHLDDLQQLDAAVVKPDA